MTICPIAIAVGCKKCPAFKFCPLTTVLGDQEEKDERDRVWEENFPTAEEEVVPVTTVLGDQEEKDEWDRVWEENFPTAEEEVVPEKKKPLTKDERLALIKERAEKKSADDID